MIKNGDETAKATLFEKYRRYSTYLAKEYIDNYPDLPISEDDYMSYAFSAVAITLNKYLEDTTIKFYAYWLTVARNDISHLIKDCLAKNKHLLNNCVSLDTQNVLKDSSYHEVIGEDDPTDRDLLKDTLIQIIKDNTDRFNETDVRLMELYLEGYAIKEIALLLNTSESNMYKRYRHIISEMRIIFTKQK